MKKLHKQQQADLDAAIKDIVEDRLIGDAKKGNLGDIRVYKFRMSRLC